jgi:hypothetical protein
MSEFYEGETGAVISLCEKYRYVLWRKWSLGVPVNFLMLNPSTADATQDDPTIRRCIGYAKAWGAGGLIVTNLFALRSTDPKALKRTPGAVGPENDRWIREAAMASASTVCAWGAHGSLYGRSRQVRRMLDGIPLASVFSLRLTAAGEPCHPLYLPADLRPTQWNPAYLFASV